MWHDLFVIQIPVPEKIIRTVAVYLVLAVLFRTIGKGGMATLNTFDFVVMFVLSNVVQNAIIGADNSLVGGLLGAVVLVAVNRGVDYWLARSGRLEHLLEGSETVLIRDGRTQLRALRRLAIRPAELEHAVRLQNGNDLSEVEDGRLAPGGHLILTLRRRDQAATRADVQDLVARLAEVERHLARLAR